MPPVDRMAEDEIYLRFFLGFTVSLSNCNRTSGERSETNRYRLRFPAGGRRRAAKTSARLRTTTLPAAALARYTATFRPASVADGKTTLSIPSKIQMAANSCETECPGPRRPSRTTFASSDGSLTARSRFRFVATART